MGHNPTRDKTISWIAWNPGLFFAEIWKRSLTARWQKYSDPNAIQNHFYSDRIEPDRVQSSPPRQRGEDCRVRSRVQRRRRAEPNQRLRLGKPVSALRLPCRLAIIAFAPCARKTSATFSASRPLRIDPALPRWTSRSRPKRLLPLSQTLPSARLRSERFTVSPQPSGKTRFIQFMSRQGESLHRCIDLRGHEAIAIQFEKENGRRKTDPFVAVHKRVIAN